ncbi:MAG: sigma-70 family RNA polymerase sigma factor, partial [Oscillospiraceae bacterium]|nr:sigma-70 family RNA polymerase sigma factor [Oscillospiraceae bacterium]
YMSQKNFKKMKLFNALKELISKGGKMGIQKVDLNSFENLYNETYKNTLKYVVCKCSNLEDVNDIIQDIYVDFYKLLKKKKELELNNANAFIIGIAKNKLKKYYGFKYKLQSRTVSKEIAEFEDIKSEANIEDAVIDGISINEIWNVIKQKKVIVGRIFYLHYSFGMTIKETAEELGISESTVKSCLYRTLKELTTTLKKESD